MLHLVAQCSAIGVSVAATPPCGAIRFCKQISLRHSDRGVERCVRQGLFFGGGVGDVARYPRNISEIAGICCDTVLRDAVSMYHHLSEKVFGESGEGVRLPRETG